MILDIAITIFVLLIGHSFKNLFSGFDSYDRKLLDKLFFYHLFMSFFFYVYIYFLSNGGDAVMYWDMPKRLSFNEVWQSLNLGGRISPTGVMFLYNFIPSNLLGLSFLTGCFMYGLLAYFGFVYLVAVIKEVVPDYAHITYPKIGGVQLFPLILFLPNVHFWSAGIGKDTPIFFAVCIFIYALFNLKKRYGFILLAALITYTIRPHITLMLFAAFALSYIYRSRVATYKKAVFILVIAGIMIPLLISVLEFVKIDSLDVSSYMEFAEQKSSALSASRSGFELSSLPYPLQVLTFLYRPLFFDAHNILALLSSIENLIWAYCTWLFIKNKPFTTIQQSHYIIFGAFLYWLIGAMAFAPVMSNLGIIVREKNMLIPAFLVFILWAFYNISERKLHGHR